MAAEVTDYCSKHTNGIPSSMQDVWQWTVKSFKDADKMSSPLQGAWMIFLAEDRQAKRILEIGSYSGYSALAWYEGTKRTKADIILLELSPEMIAATRRTLDTYNLNDRVTLIEGPAQESIATLTGTFDIVFVDANKDGYLGYVKAILDQNLLAPNGVIVCDNGEPQTRTNPHITLTALILHISSLHITLTTPPVFARGMTISTSANPDLDNSVRPYWTECGKALQKFNDYVVNDPRVDVTMLPVFDGVSMIKWKVDDSNRTDESVDGLGEKGSAANGDFSSGVVRADGVMSGHGGNTANGNLDAVANGIADE
ncbi:MAG: hypothetical protein Q9180_004252 [Flavoplaca navasiana]